MQTLTRRRFLQLSALFAAGGVASLEACARKASAKTVKFFNWFNYIGKETLPGFEKETGVHVDYEVYSSEEEMFAKLKAGVRGYDLLVVTDFMIPRLKALNLIDRMPRELLTNLGNIGRRFSNPQYDPGLEYSVPYLWGTTGIGFNRTKFPNSPNSWWDLWDARYKGRITMLDNVRDAVATALLLLNLPIDTKNSEHLLKARDLLVKQRPLLKHYTSSNYVDDLAAGEVWLSQGWNGDVLQAARDRGQIDFVLPKEGSFMYVDSLVLMRGAARKQEVLRLIDHILRPQVAAEISNTVRYATPNEKALQYVEASLRGDSRVFPTPEMQRSLRFHTPLGPDGDELWNQTWQQVKVL